MSSSDSSPIADIAAAKLGVDEATASQAVNQALPALLDGLQANAEDPAGAESIARAVQQHDPKLLDGRVSLNDVDENDGDKIVGHVFGAKKPDVVAAIGDLLGGLIGGGGAGKGRGGDIGDLLGGLLGRGRR